MTYDKLESKAAIDPQLPMCKTMEETVKALNRREKAFYVSGTMAAPLSPEEKAEWKDMRDGAIRVGPPLVAVVYACVFGGIAYIGESTREDSLIIMLAAAVASIVLSLCTLSLLFRPWQSHIRIRLRLYQHLDTDKRSALYSSSDDISEAPREDRLFRYSTKQVQDGVWLIRDIIKEILLYSFLGSCIFIIVVFYLLLTNL